MKLNDPLVDGGQVITEFEFVQDGARVVYIADALLDSAPGLGSSPVRDRAATDTPM